MNHRPEVGEWVRVRWATEHGANSDLGCCTEIEHGDGYKSPTWFKIRLHRENREILFESYSLEKLSLLEKLAIAADDRFSGGMK